MAIEDEVLVQLATRLPRSVHRQVKMYCVQHDVPMMEFVSEALLEKLGRAKEVDTPRRKARRAGAA